MVQHFNTNVYSTTGHDGGWAGYKGNGYEEDNVATHLHAVGYRTALFGKYLNEYSGTDVPPGWDDWFAFLHPIDYYGYDVNDNGIRTSTSKYLEYEGGFRELYNIGPGTDPYELTNIYYNADPTVPPRPDLKTRLDALESCAGADASATSCKMAEGG